MRFFVFLFLLCLSCPVYAQNNFWERPKVHPAPTKAQVDESIRIFQDCRTSEEMSRYYDCQCVAAHFLDLRVQGSEDSQPGMIEQAEKLCANQPGIAGSQYQRCLSWAPRQRDDYETYCRCYANTYAKNFARTPNDTIRGREDLMTNALGLCDSGDQIGEMRARESVIDWLKQTQVYKALFPGAVQP